MGSNHCVFRIAGVRREPLARSMEILLRKIHPTRHKRFDMKIPILTLMLLVDTFGFALADEPKSLLPASPATISGVKLGTLPGNKNLEAARKKWNGSTGTKRPRRPKKTATQS
jgi:hypothetical protein